MTNVGPSLALVSCLKERSGENDDTNHVALFVLGVGSIQRTTDRSGQPPMDAMELLRQNRDTVRDRSNKRKMTAIVELVMFWET